MKASKAAIWGLGILATVCLAPDAKAQHMIDTKARQKATWYNAPREVQIIDERPVVRDFREAPAAPSMLQLPPGPQGFGGPGGGSGGGAMGDGGGGSPVIPGGGMPIGGGGGDPGYRTPSMGGLPLDKAGFTSRPTNIPAGGIRPKGVLPNGQTTGVHGSLMTPTAHQVAPASAAGPRAAMAPARVATPAASYGGNYTHAPSGGGSMGGSGASTAVRGVLLNRLKN